MDIKHKLDKRRRMLIDTIYECKRELVRIDAMENELNFDDLSQEAEKEVWLMLCALEKVTIGAI